MHAKIKASTVDSIAKQAKMVPSYFILMATSGVLAAVAFLSDSVPLLVGSMVISPVFAPLALVSFAAASGRYSLALRGLNTVLLGLLLAAVFAAMVTWLLNTTQVFPRESNLMDKALV